MESTFPFVIVKKNAFQSAIEFSGSLLEILVLSDQISAAHFEKLGNFGRCKQNRHIWVLSEKTIELLHSRTVLVVGTGLVVGVVQSFHK